MTATIPSLMNELTRTLKRIKSKVSSFKPEELDAHDSEIHKTFVSQLGDAETYIAGLAQTVNELSVTSTPGGTTSHRARKVELPFVLTPADEAHLRINFPPVEIKMPVFNFNKDKDRDGSQQDSDEEGREVMGRREGGSGGNGGSGTKSVDEVVNHDAFREEKTAKTDVRSIMQARARARAREKAKADSRGGAANGNGNGNGHDMSGLEKEKEKEKEEKEKDMDVEEAMRELTSMFTKFSVEAERERIPYPGWNPIAVEVSSIPYFTYM